MALCVNCVALCVNCVLCVIKTETTNQGLVAIMTELSAISNRPNPVRQYMIIQRNII